MPDLAHLWRRIFGWVPIQFCLVCGHWYWGGLPRVAITWPPRWQWLPHWKEFCSKKCCDDDGLFWDGVFGRAGK